MTPFSNPRSNAAFVCTGEKEGALVHLSGPWILMTETQLNQLGPNKALFREGSQTHGKSRGRECHASPIFLLLFHSQRPSPVSHTIHSSASSTPHFQLGLVPILSNRVLVHRCPCGSVWEVCMASVPRRETV